MGRPRVNRALPLYASEFIDRHGKARIRLRRTGWQTLYVKAAPGTAEFTEAYHAWLAGGKPRPGAAKVMPGTFDDLIARFYRSKIWADLKETTRGTYRGELERFRSKYGGRQVATMTARHVGNLILSMAATPSAANNLRKRLRQLFDLAVQCEMRVDNPVLVIRGIRAREGGFATWQEEQIAAYEARHPLGTAARLAFDLALYTAQRKSDVRVMGPQHVKDGRIAVRQLKTDKEMKIPIHPRLAESIAATPTGHLAYLVSSQGRPFTAKGFGMWFMRRCREAGLEGFSMHGLRKAASRRMAEAGLSNQLIKSITGHVTDAEVSRYTREAEQVLMADKAIGMMAFGLPSEIPLANPSEKPSKVKG